MDVTEKLKTVTRRNSNLGDRIRGAIVPVVLTVAVMGAAWAYEERHEGITLRETYNMIVPDIIRHQLNPVVPYMPNNQYAPTLHK